MMRHLPPALAIAALVLIVGWFARPVAGDAIGALWVPPPSTPRPWELTATAKAMPRTATPTRTSTPSPTPRPTMTPTPTATPVPTRTPTATTLATATRDASGGIGRPPQHCQAEFTITGSASFHASVWDNLTTIYAVSPADYEAVMACVAGAGGTQTRVRRIIQADPPYATHDAPYSDSSGTIWLKDGRGYLAAALLLHEMLHIARYGWNAPGSRDCSREDATLEHQAKWLERAADTVGRDQAAALRYYADFFEGQKGKHNCPAP